MALQPSAGYPSSELPDGISSSPPSQRLTIFRAPTDSFLPTTSPYAVSRLFITKTCSGNETGNLSGIVGAGAATGIGKTRYTADTNVWVKAYQCWLGQIVQDRVSQNAKEFRPDINRSLFHSKY
jgi:hypothetical protein